ncbi:VOC family protein [Streptomyces sp. NBC_01754]|uniref:VOC family protein n=1 Tax=Streptomyces sp. NBC_01754 TaxID=2975930 RepID=UPI002DDB1EC2|nr:VOC family protein [Streptomyces sp. NBC_01754]WSC93113.1 VOC family protein [Streptomyces sp. NBC_01754]
MSVTSVTHLNFRGDARAALGFYHSVFGGELAAVTYREAGSAGESDEADQVMWGQVTAENGFRVMAYDVPSRLPWERGANSFFVSLRGDDAAEVRAYWEKLSAGASVVQPLGPARWAPLYGMLEDRYGVVWVVDVVSGYGR